MRLKANVMGYSLNQRGLFGNVIRDPRDRRVKLNDGKYKERVKAVILKQNLLGVLIASETEEEIFKILNVPWQEPHERVRG
jgi:DNA polymerase lambda